MKKCVVCRRNFKPVKNQKTCSPECSEQNKGNYSRDYHLQLYHDTKEDDKKIANCERCGDKFNKKGKMIYCPNCKEKVKEEYQQRYYLEVTLPKREKRKAEMGK